MTVAPGGTIGIIGGGQLGAMLAMAAATLGYRCHVLAPDHDPPAARVAARFVRAAHDDAAALAEFAAATDVVTYEFENLPVGPLKALGEQLRPGVRSLEIAQDRVAEKRFLESCGARVAPWREVNHRRDLDAAVVELGVPLVLKSRRLGYDGKGQAWVRSTKDIDAALEAVGGGDAVAEAGVQFAAEFSVLLARGVDGAVAVWDIPENLHREGILRRSSVPAGAEVLKQANAAVALATDLAERLDHIGVLTVEYFATAEGPLVNEIAPRVHNSGHWTIEGAATSQFEQHIRAICGLPLGASARRADTLTMDNLIGDDAGQWAGLAAEAGAHLHLYGKGEPRPGRKMGHVTRLR